MYDPGCVLRQAAFSSAEENNCSQTFKSQISIFSINHRVVCARTLVSTVCARGPLC